MTCGYGKEAMWNGGVVPECIWTPEFLLFLAVLVTFVGLAITDWREFRHNWRGAVVVLVAALYTVFSPILGLFSGLVMWYLFR